MKHEDVEKGGFVKVCLGASPFEQRPQYERIEARVLRSDKMYGRGFEHCLGSLSEWARRIGLD